MTIYLFKPTYANLPHLFCFKLIVLFLNIAVQLFFFFFEKRCVRIMYSTQKPSTYACEHQDGYRKATGPTAIAQRTTYNNQIHTKSTDSP